MTFVENTLLALVRSGINNSSDSIGKLSSKEWSNVIDLAEKQGVLAIAFDGVQHLSKNCQPDIDNLMEWLGQTSYMETQYEEHKRVIEHLSHFYEEQGIKMMILKGYGVSLDYPHPNHRPVGDIDVYLYGLWQFADQMMHDRMGIFVDESQYHHSTFQFEGMSVENHFDFLNIHSHKSNNAIEQRLKELTKEKGKEILPNVFLPCPNLSALFVIRHAACDFAAGNMTLRQMLDCILVMYKHKNEIDWDAFWQDVMFMGMQDFALTIVSLANKILEYSMDSFHIPTDCHVNEKLTKDSLTDIFHSKYAGERPKGYLKYVPWMLGRWWSNRWKHKMVYSDSLLSTFVYQTISHFKKPELMKG